MKYQELNLVLKRYFSNIEMHDYGVVKVWVAKLPTGQSISFSRKTGKPRSVQISFTTDFDVRKKYGIVSHKDFASNQTVMPGSLAMMRIFKALAIELKAANVKITFNAIDKRRRKIYGNWLNKL